MPFSPILKACLADVIADPMFLGSADIASRIDWHEFGYGKLMAIEAGSADSEDGPRLAQFRLLVQVQQNRCFLKPCGHWNGPGDFGIPFVKSKSNADVGPSSYPEIKDLWKSVLDGIRNIKNMPSLRSGSFALPAGAKVVKDIIKDTVIEVRKDNFVGPDVNSDDEKSAARDQEALNASYGSAWATCNLPCVSDAAKKARDEIVEDGKYAAKPLMAYLVKFPEEGSTAAPTRASSIASSSHQDTESVTDESQREGAVPEPELVLIEPSAVDRMLRGSLVDLRVSITRQYVQRRNQVLFMAEIHEAYVIERRTEPPSILGKRGAGPSLFKSKRARMA